MKTKAIEFLLEKDANIVGDFGKALFYDTPRDIVHAARGAVNQVGNAIAGKGFDPSDGILGKIDTEAFDRVSAPTKAVFYDTPRDIIHATRGTVNQVGNSIVGKGLDPSHGIAGTIDQEAFDRVNNAAALPITGMSELTNRAMLGTARLYDMAIPSWTGGERIAPTLERDLNRNQEALRQSLYTGDQSFIRQAENPMAEAFGLALLAGMPAAGASRFLPASVEALQVTGRDPSYSATHDDYGLPIDPATGNYVDYASRDNQPASQATDMTKILGPLAGVNIAPGAGTGNLVGQGLKGIYDMYDTSSAQKRIAANVESLDSDLRGLSSVARYYDALQNGDVETAKKYRGDVESLLGGDNNAKEVIDRLNQRIMLVGLDPKDIGKEGFADDLDARISKLQDMFKYTRDDRERWFQDSRDDTVESAFWLAGLPLGEKLLKFLGSRGLRAIRAAAGR